MGGWGAGEGQGAFKKGWPGISVCAPAGKVAGISGGRCGWPFARVRRRGDEAGRRARGAVRERATRAAARSRPRWSGGAVERAVAERRAGAGLGHGGKTGSRAESWAERAVRENWLGQCAGPKREKERAD